jgi:hypothetical protein
VFWFPTGDGIVLFLPVSRPALGLTQPPIGWVPGGSFPGVKRQYGFLKYIHLLFARNYIEHWFFSNVLVLIVKIVTYFYKYNTNNIEVIKYSLFWNVK